MWINWDENDFIFISYSSSFRSISCTTCVNLWMTQSYVMKTHVISFTRVWSDPLIEALQCAVVARSSNTVAEATKVEMGWDATTRWLGSSWAPLPISPSLSSNSKRTFCCTSTDFPRRSSHHPDFVRRWIHFQPNTPSLSPSLSTSIYTTFSLSHLFYPF